MATLNQEMRAKLLKYEDGSAAVFRYPISGTSKEVPASKGLQGTRSIRRGKRCSKGRWGKDDGLAGLEGDHSVKGWNAANGEVSREVLGNMIPPGGAGEPVHNCDSTKVEKDRRNTCWFCKWVSNMFVPKSQS